MNIQESTETLLYQEQKPYSFSYKVRNCISALKLMILTYKTWNGKWWQFKVEKTCMLVIGR